MKNRESLSEKIKHLIHPLIIKMLSAKRQFKLEIVGDIPKGKQFIFIANHYCIDDIPTVAEVIKKHVYVLVSDEDRHTLNGLALNTNGVVWVNRLNKDERKKSKDALLRHLKLGHNILMYPEATWNLSPNLLMLPMNYGCISLSLETGVPIVPIYLYFSENVCRVEINAPFYPTGDKILSIEKLRDIMATSAWKFYEEQHAHRSDLDTAYWENNIAKRYAKYDRAKKDPVGVQLYESQFIYRPKLLATYKEVFTHLNMINPTMQNAFLFNKRLK